jgi:hypothetical protein
MKRWLRRRFNILSPSEEFTHWGGPFCLHVNGWHNVYDDGRHDVLVRECADGCGHTVTVRAANPRCPVPPVERHGPGPVSGPSSCGR